MSGHSKWSTIKRQKGVTDAKRGALFTKVAREISVAARQGGGDPDANYRLRLAIEKARSVNMPSDNIKRTIDKATGGGEADQYEEIVYEGYGPGGVAVLVEAQTDNRNRTAAEVRSMFTKSGGQLAGSGAVAWQFEPRGLITVVRSGAVDADEVALTAIDAGAEDVDTDGDEAIEVYTTPGELESVRKALESAGVPVESAESAMIAKQTVELDAAKARQALRLVELLEDLDDVSRVTANFDIPEEVFAEVAGVIVLGIDPGTAALGYGIVESTAGRVREVDHGCLETSPDVSLPERLLAIHALVDELLASHQPSLLAVERLFFSKNVQTAFGVGQARGVVLLAAAQHGVPVREATPNEVKSAIAGYGAADKEQVQRMVQMVLGMAERPRPDDAADALAIAVWGVNTAASAPARASAVMDRSAIQPIQRGASGYERAVREALVREKAAEREAKRAAKRTAS